jgi:hypothetical protein
MFYEQAKQQGMKWLGRRKHHSKQETVMLAHLLLDIIFCNTAM